MTLAILKKIIRNNKGRFFIYALISVVYVAMIAAFFPAVQENRDKFEELLSAYPPALVEAFGISGDTFTTFAGFMSAEYFSLMYLILLCLLIFSFGASILAGERDRGTAEFTFSLPCKRSTMFRVSFIALYAMVAAIIGISLLSVMVSAKILGEKMVGVGLSDFFILSLLMSFALLSFTAFLSSLSKSVSKVYGACAAFLVGSYLVHVLASLSEAAEKIYFLSFLKYYGKPTEILMGHGVPGEHLLVFLLAGAVFLAATVYNLRQLDL